MSGTPSRVRLLVAYGIVYVLWGSTYLAIRYAVQTLPPFLLGGTRFLLAGGILFTWSRIIRKEAPLSAAHWLRAAVSGAFMLLGGNGAVVWAEQSVPSNLAALLAATMPFWMVLFEWLGPARRPPASTVVGGLIVGIAGIAVLVGDSTGFSPTGSSMPGAAIVVAGSVSWAAGSLYSRYANFPTGFCPPAAQMLAGGTLLVALSVASGEIHGLDPAAVSAASVLSWGYLVTVGSLVGFTAYIWLLRHQPPARVSTYAYVNPVVAVLLGWAIAGEALSPRAIAAGAMVVAAVVIVTMSNSTPADSQS
jgi:drug/metabolite transporter (DMT)-like permease